MRAPCPGLNTLANHGFIPHDGRNITSEIVQKGFKDAMNIDEALSAAAFKPALELNPGASVSASLDFVLSVANVIPKVH